MAGNRPRWVALIAGTGTEVGKTWTAVRVVERLVASGFAVAARKPAQSFAPDGAATDAELLAAATGEPPHTVCAAHRWYEVPMAPFMAAEVLGRPPFTMTDLAGELHWEPATDIAIVESVGGVRSPITSDGLDTVDLARAISPDIVILVADAGLGTINAVRLAVEPLAPHRTTVFLNRFESANDLHQRNRDWLRAHLTTNVAESLDQLLDLFAPGGP